MGLALTSAVTYTTLTCSCGVCYALPDSFIKEREKDHRTFYCPNGCSRWYPNDNEVERLQKQLKTEQQRREWVEQDLETTKRQRDHNERRRAAVQGKVTLLKKRIGKGSCPCCKERFPDLQRHIAEKHPGYGE